MGVLLLLGLLHGCSPLEFKVPLPPLGGARSALFLSSSAPGEGRAVELSPGAHVELELPLGDDAGGTIYAMAFSDDLAALGLGAGLVRSAPDPSRAAPFSLLHAASYSEDGVGEWVTLTEAPERVRAFRLARRSACTSFTLARISALDGFHVRRALGLPDGRALAMGVTGVALVAPDGVVEARVDAPAPTASAGISSDGVVYAVGIGVVARILLDPLRYEVVATGTVAEEPVKWVAVEAGPDPAVYALSGTGALTRGWPAPSWVIDHLPIVGEDAAQGGVAVLGKGDVVAATSGSAYVFRYQEGVKAMATPLVPLVGFDAMIAAGGRVVMAVAPSGALLSFDGERFVDLPGIAAASVLELAPFGETYVAATEGGVLGEYVAGERCPIANPDLRDASTLAPLASGFLVGGRDTQGLHTWWIMRPNGGG